MKPKDQLVSPSYGREDPHAFSQISGKTGLLDYL